MSEKSRQDCQGWVKFPFPYSTDKAENTPLLHAQKGDVPHRAQGQLLPRDHIQA